MAIDKDKVLRSIDFKPTAFFAISRRSGLKHNQNRELNETLNKLRNQGLIDRNRNGSFQRLKVINDNYQGVIFRHAKGFGFLDFEDGSQSAFVPRFRIGSVMNKDEVKAVIVQDPRHSDKFVATITEVVKRNTKFIVGTLIKSGKDYLLTPLGNALDRPVYVNNVTDDLLEQRIKVEITEYGRDFLKATFVETFGSTLDPRSIIDGLVANAGIPVQFEPKTIIEAKEIPSEVSQIPHGVKDLRDLITVTVDGETTKDFDDAITIVAHDNCWDLYVHIADVAHYVKENSALDEEALDRGNSVYLVDRTIPMLPKKLSDGICSLNPHVDRLTLTAQMQIDKEGKNIDFKLYRSLINSNYRLTYNQVNDFYENSAKGFTPEIDKMLTHALDLSKILGKKKHQDGYVDLEIEEAKVIVDETAKPIDVKVIKRGFSEILIENFMVRANESVATYMNEHQNPCVYRVHDAPQPLKFEIMQATLKALDIPIDFKATKSPKVFAGYVEAIKKRHFDNFLKTMVLRTMEKAIYSPKNIGHFGLASKMYSHFTSPIRRYADLILHRMIHELVFDKKGQKDKAHFQKTLPHICEHISATERTAMELERKVADVKKAEFMLDKLGLVQEAQVVTITKFGVFVEMENQISGLIRFAQGMEKDDVKINKTNTSVNYSGHDLRLGKKIKVKITAVDQELGQISLALV